MSDSKYPDNGLPEAVNDISRNSLSDSGIDRIFDMLSVRHRRLILLSLKEGGVKTEADLLVRGMNDPEDVGVGLNHQHLPKLAEAEYIEWDRDTGEISRGPRFGEIEPLLTLIEQHADELPSDWP